MNNSTEESGIEKEGYNRGEEEVYRGQLKDLPIPVSHGDCASSSEKPGSAEGTLVSRKTPLYARGASLCSKAGSSYQEPGFTTGSPVIAPHARLLQLDSAASDVGVEIMESSQRLCSRSPEVNITHSD